MSDSIVPAPPPGAIAPLEALLEAAGEFARQSRPDSTKRAYTGDWERFRAWADTLALPTTAETVGLYLTHLARSGKRVSTIERALAAISVVARTRGESFDRKAPAIHEVLRGIRHELGTAPEQKRPVEDQLLRRMVAELPADGWRAWRDRAILLLGWFTACRRSELAALDVGDITFVDEGLEVVLRRSKTDQDGAGRVIGVPYAGAPELCPVRALRAYMEHAGITEGPLFLDIRAGTKRGRLSDRAIYELVKRACRRAGLPEADFGAHSLRAGFVTTAAKRGKGLEAIMRQTGHRTERTVRCYIRHATVFVDNAAAGLV